MLRIKYWEREEDKEEEGFLCSVYIYPILRERERIQYWEREDRRRRLIACAQYPILREREREREEEEEEEAENTESFLEFWSVSSSLIFSPIFFFHMFFLLIIFHWGWKITFYLNVIYNINENKYNKII